MLNKVILIGRVFENPELRYFKNNNIITIIKLVTTEIDNYGKEQNYWHRVIINKKCKGIEKNMIVFIEGKIKTRKWIKNNRNNYITEIISEEVKVINDKNYNEKMYNESKIDDNIDFESENLEKNEEEKNHKIEKENEKIISNSQTDDDIDKIDYDYEEQEY